VFGFIINTLPRKTKPCYDILEDEVRNSLYSAICGYRAKKTSRTSERRKIIPVTMNAPKNITNCCFRKAQKKQEKN